MIRNKLSMLSFRFFFISLSWIGYWFVVAFFLSFSIKLVSNHVYFSLQKKYAEPRRRDRRYCRNIRIAPILNPKLLSFYLNFEFTHKTHLRDVTKIYVRFCIWYSSTWKFEEKFKWEVENLKTNLRNVWLLPKQK